MKKIVVYYSMTGNTLSIANKIAADTKATIKEVNDVTVEEVLEYDVIILGCPAMGSEELEEETFQPFCDELFEKIEKQKVYLFGSYGWGDGEWMRTWVSTAKENNVNLGLDEGLIVNGSDADIEESKYKLFINSINN